MSTSPSASRIVFQWMHESDDTSSQILTILQLACGGACSMHSRWRGALSAKDSVTGLLLHPRLGTEVLAQDAADIERPAAVAVMIPEAPTLDGDVLNDPAWSGVTPTSGFIQKTPNTGQPVSERTEVYIAYTGDTLYFGVVCYDREPGKIVVADSRRDSELDETDSFQIILDTYRDEQTGFVFGTNPVGIEYDGQVTREGEGGAPFRPVGSTRTGTPCGRSAREISEIGWSAEFAIPFTTLRYPRGEEQVWTLNMQRNIRRHNEQSFWSPIPIQFEIYRLALAGSVAGLQVPSQRNLKLLPYVLGEIQKESAETSITDHNFEFGIDLKYSITPSLTLDATYNTDFAQVEADDFQINLNRFNIFFPEKRPFFLENAGYFSVGVPKRLSSSSAAASGSVPAGEVVPIIAGARMSGKLAEQYNVGALYMRTEAVPGVDAGERFCGRTPEPGLPEPVLPRGNRRQSPRLWRARFRGRLQSHLLARRTAGDRRVRPPPGFCRQDRDPRRRRGRICLPTRGQLRLRALVVLGQLHRGGRRLQPGGRFPDPEGLPQAVGLRAAPHPARGPLGVARDSAARFVQRVLGLRRIPGNRCSARRHPLGVALVVRAPHRGQLHPRGGEGGVRDLPGYQCFSRDLRQRRGGARASSPTRGRRSPSKSAAPFRWFLRRRPAVADPELAVSASVTPSTPSWVGTTTTSICPKAHSTINLGSLRLSYSFSTLINLQALIQYNDRDDIWAANLRFCLAPHCQQRSLRRLQREPGHPSQRLRLDQKRSQPDRQIHLPLRSPELNPRATAPSRRRALGEGDRSQFPVLFLAPSVRIDRFESSERGKWN